MTTVMSSSSDGRSLDEVKQNQMDRLDEMQKLDGDVICLNSAYIDILDRITNKLDMLAHLAEEIESDARAHPQSMEDGLKTRFDLLSQSALMNRFMCTKALYQNAVGSIQAISQFGSNFIDNGTIGAPIDPSTSECTENASQEPRLSDASGDTLSSDSDATVAARMDISDSQLSVTEEEVGTTDGDGPSTSVLPQSLYAPSTLQLEEEDLKAYVARELEEIRIEDAKDAVSTELAETMHVEMPKDPSENVVSSSSALSVRSLEWNRDGDGRLSVADSVHSFESMESVEEEGKRKKKKKKRSESAEQRRRSREAEKMENILNTHLKRSMEKQPMNRKEENSNMSPLVSPLPMKDIEVVTISDDEQTVTQFKKSRVDDYEDILSGNVSSRIVPGPMAPTEDEDYENNPLSRNEACKMKSDIEIVHPPTDRLSVSQCQRVPPPPPPSSPPPPPPPVLPPELDRHNGAVSIQEPPMASLDGERRAPADIDSSVSERSMIEERPEWREGEEREDGGADEIEEEYNVMGPRCESRDSLMDSISVSFRHSVRNSPDKTKTGLPRSLSYSPIRDKSRSRSMECPSREKSRSRSRERSRSRSRERRDWRWAPRFRYGYRHRYRRWSRSPTRSRSRHRSFSRDKDDSRNRSMSRSLSRSRSRSRSISRSRSVSRGRSYSPSSPTDRNASSPPRAYARFFNRSSEKRERRREEKKVKNEDIIKMELEERSPSPQVSTARVDSGSPPSPSMVLDPPPPAPVIDVTPSTPISPLTSQPHSGSSSPSTFVPAPPIILPKPTPLKISIPSTLCIKTKTVCVSVSGSTSSTGLVEDASLPVPPKETAHKKEGLLDKNETKDTTNRTVDSSSDMSLEGNTVSETSNGEEKSKKTQNDIASIPTPPLSNPSAMEKKSTDGRESIVPVAPQVTLPPLPPISRSVETPPPPPLTDTTPSRVPSTTNAFMSTPMSGVMGGSRASSSRTMNGAIQIYPLLGGPHPNQYYSSMGAPQNPYGHHSPWMQQDPQWQQYYYNGYNQDPAMMGAGFGNPSVSHHPSVMNQGPIPEQHGSFMKAMRVIPSSINPQPPPDWAQMARDHANQQLHVACVPPPPPPLNQQGHLMSHIPLYGTPQVGRGGSRFRGGGGKGRRRW